VAEYAFLLLGGPQKGAELNLTHDGEYKIGASLDSDIYLPVYGLNDQEFTLSIKKNTLSLAFVHPSMSDAFVNGRPFAISAGDIIAIKPFDIVIYGALEFCVKIMGQKNPKDLTHRLQEYQQMIAEHERQKMANSLLPQSESAESDTDTPSDEATTEEAAPEQDSKAASQSNQLNSNDMKNDSDDLTDSTAENSTASLDSAETHSNKKKAMRVLEILNANKQIIIALVVFSVLAYQGIVLISQSNTQETTDSTSQTNIKKIEGYLQGNGLTHLSVKSDDQHKKPLIEGYLKNKQEKSKILDDFKKQQIQADLKVKLTQDQINGVRDLFETYGVKGLTIEEVDMMGTFILQGYVANTSQWDKANRYISRDFPDIKNLINKVETPGTRKKLLEDLLKERALLGDVQIKLEKDQIVATTYLLPDDQMTWRSVVAEYNQITNGVPSITTKPADLSWLDITSLHVGDPSYIVLKDGKKYLEGTIIGGTAKLEKITETALIFETQRGKTAYPLSK
jgi:type III secretion system YscD/HrpQ family protein